jgi:hypothetical protein
MQEIEWMVLTMVAVTLGCLGFWTLWKLDTKLRRPTLQTRMEGFAEQAVQIAKDEFRLELDYTLDTVSKLDGILEQFHQRHRSRPIVESDLSRLVLVWGGYLGTVLQRLRGGVWESDSLIAGNNTYPLRFGAREAVPIMWCLRKIRRGSEISLEQLVTNFFDSLDDSVEGNLRKGIVG